MADASIDAPDAARNEEDYTGALCLLVRERKKRRRHAEVEVLIDADRLADVAPFDWVLSGGKRDGLKRYVAAFSPMPGMQGWVLSLHRFLADPPQDKVVDHKNRKPLDNRGQNHRVCTHLENNMNREGSRKSSSKYKGVSLARKGRKTRWGRDCSWTASATLHGKTHHLGTYRVEEHAAAAYNAFVKHHFPDFAYLNPVPEFDFITYPKPPWHIFRKYPWEEVFERLDALYSSPRFPGETRRFPPDVIRVGDPQG